VVDDVRAIIVERIGVTPRLLRDERRHGHRGDFGSAALEERALTAPGGTHRDRDRYE
jgi:hypothetical protein